MSGGKFAFSGNGVAVGIVTDSTKAGVAEGSNKETSSSISANVGNTVGDKITNGVAVGVAVAAGTTGDGETAAIGMSSAVEPANRPHDTKSRPLRASIKIDILGNFVMFTN